MHSKGFAPEMVAATAAAAGERSEHGADDGATLPRAVTRGESTEAAQTGAKLDWLNATFQGPTFSVEAFVTLIGKFLGRPTSGTEGRGLFGFQTGVKLRAYFGGSMVDIGALAFGGDSQRGRWMLQLTGKGCGLVTDWAALQCFLEELGAKITRCDLAVDFTEGEYTVDDAVRFHEEGGFTGSGRRPTTATAGDWLDRVRGRTLYVGKGSNGKLLRVYEKGIQLGDIGSPWVRYEVQLGARDREIPLEVLTSPTKYFAGAYPCLAELVEEAAEKIPTVRAEAKVSLTHLLYHAKRCYGKVFDVLSRLGGSSSAELVEEIRVIGIPRRLTPSGLAAGVSWSDVQDLLRKRERS